MRFQLHYMNKVKLSSVFTDRVIYFLIVSLFLIQIIHYNSGEHLENNRDFLRSYEQELITSYIEKNGGISNTSILDSLRSAANWYQHSLGVQGSSFGVGPVHIAQSGNYDTIRRKQKHYLGLERFYLRNRTEISLSGEDVVVLNRDDTLSKSTAVRYDVKDYQLLFEINGFLYWVINIGLYGLMVVVFALSLANAFSLPLAILSNISKGKFFAEKNLVNIKFIAKTTLFWTTIVMLINASMIMVYYPGVRKYFFFDWFEFFKGYANFYIVGLIALLLSRAFKKGYQLQQENDLIV